MKKIFFFLITLTACVSMSAQEIGEEISRIETVLSDTVAINDTTSQVIYFLRTEIITETGYEFKDTTRTFRALGDSTASVDFLYRRAIAGDPDGTGWQAFYARISREFYYRAKRLDWTNNQTALFDSIGNTNIYDVVVSNNIRFYEGRWRLRDGANNDTYELWQAPNGIYFLRLESDPLVRYRIDPRFRTGFELFNFPNEGDRWEMILDGERGVFRPLEFLTEGSTIIAIKL
jgi:hypothetical protein